MAARRRTVATGEGVDGHMNCNHMEIDLRAPQKPPKNESLMGEFKDLHLRTEI